MSSERKDYYKILGISDSEKELTGDEFEKVLKSKFRKLSLKYHPDKNPGDKDAEAKFKDIAEAYDVLHNKREEYDNPSSGFKFEGFTDFNDIFGGFSPFSDIFSSMGMGGERKKEPRGSNLRIEFAISLEESYNGVKKREKYSRYVTCESCGGSGKTAETKEKPCTVCGGTGFVYQSNGFMQMGSTCRHCGGTGKIIENPCKKCNGHGLTLKSTEVEFTVPRGVATGSSIRLPGLGNMAPHGKGESGDLYIVFVIKRHPVFYMEGNNLVCTCKVNVLDAITGCKKEIMTISGKKLSVMIPRGTSDGDKLKINGHGMPLQGGGYGSLIIIVNVVMPRELTDEEVELIEVLKTKPNFNK